MKKIQSAHVKLKTATPSVTLPQEVTSGNLLVVRSEGLIIDVKDSSENKWKRASAGQWTTRTAISGPVTVTVTLPGAGHTDNAITVEEILPE